MSDAAAGIKAGTFSVTAHDRIIFGTPAGEAVLAEAERYGAKRVFVTSTRSLAQKDDGPLQRMEQALGARHVGTLFRHQLAQPARGRGGRRQCRARGQGGPAGRRGRRFGDRCDQGHAAVPLAGPR